MERCYGALCHLQEASHSDLHVPFDPEGTAPTASSCSSNALSLNCACILKAKCVPTRTPISISIASTQEKSSWVQWPADHSHSDLEVLHSPVLSPFHHQYRASWLRCNIFSEFMYAENVVCQTNVCTWKELWTFNILHQMLKPKSKGILFFVLKMLSCLVLPLLLLRKELLLNGEEELFIRGFSLNFNFIPY